MKNVFGLKTISTLAIAFVLILASCKKDEEFALSRADTQDVNSESATDSYNDEVIDISNISIAGVSESLYSGRTEGEPVTNLKDIDDRFKCAAVTITRAPNSQKIDPIGSIVIDFGTGCTDSRGVTRKGKIIVNYDGKRFSSGSTIITTFENYFRNDVKIEGTHTLTNVQVSLTGNPKFTINITGGKITFADGTFITRSQNFTREWIRGGNPAQDQWKILAGSAAEGSNRNGKSYTMTLTADLVYSRACAISNKVFIPVSGTKVFVVNGKTYSVDFGTGNCDNDVTVSVGGASKTITVGADGN